LASNLIQGGRVAKKSFLVQLMVGFAEIIIGTFTFSIALVADGIQSFADAGVSLIVWTGLRIAKKAPDARFHFGYYRFETLSSIIAAIFMAVLGVVVVFQSYQEFLNPTKVENPLLAMIAALAAAFVSTGLLLYKRQAAKKYGTSALKTDAANSIKDVLTSITAFVGIGVSAYLGITQMDAVAGVIISIFVFTMVYTILKESSLVLLDSFTSPEIVEMIEFIAHQQPQVKGVHSVRLRRLGSYVIGDMHVTVEGEMSVKEGAEIAFQIEMQTKKAFKDIIEVNVLVEPAKENKAES
jgi:cation diffusion facilitator family transporter